MAAFRARGRAGLAITMLRRDWMVNKPRRDIPVQAAIEVLLRSKQGADLHAPYLPPPGQMQAWSWPEAL